MEVASVEDKIVSVGDEVLWFVITVLINLCVQTSISACLSCNTDISNSDNASLTS